MEFKEELRLLKVLFKVTTNRELGGKIGLTEDGIKNWIRKKAIPKKYKCLLENKNLNSIQGNNNININGNNINVNHSSNDICNELNKLSNDKREYFYHLIKAEVLKEKM